MNLSDEKIIARMKQYTNEDTNVRIYEIEDLIKQFIKVFPVTSEEQLIVMDHVLAREAIAQDHIEKGVDAKGEKILSPVGYMKSTRVRARGFGLLIAKKLL